MTFKLAHLSDIHLSALPKLNPGDFLSKRLFGYLNWRRGRSAIHRSEILAKLIDDMRAQNPDQIAITGDLTNLGLAEEYEAVRNWLRDLAPIEQLSIVPGNHDAYVPGALESGLLCLSDWLPAAPGKDVFPYVRVHEKIALIGLSSAIASAPFLATGRLGIDQLSKLASILDQQKTLGRFRIVLLHHALQVLWHQPAKRLLDAPALETILARHGAELVLHGHLHRKTYHTLKGAQSMVHVFGAPSASVDPAKAGNGAGYMLYSIEPKEKDKGWRVDAVYRGIGHDLKFQTLQKSTLEF
jgi:3',5'-cyclic AMP phosphodiesterase CpdA